jgi:FkbM family methyltransferase
MIKIIKRKIKKLILKLSGKVGHLKKGVKCKYAWYGNQYGGFYVCPEFLNEKSVVYSFGIGEDISFDKAIIKNHGCEVFGFDPTPKSIRWVESQDTPVEFRFYDFGISNKSGLIDFYLPKNADFVSGSIIDQINIDTEKKVSVKMKTIQDILNELNHKHIDVLKMDIEGAEYDVIGDILNCNISVDQILIEFHDRFFKDGRLKSYQAVKNLNSKGYEIFAASDSFEEISFINKNILGK